MDGVHVLVRNDLHAGTEQSEAVPQYGRAKRQRYRCGVFPFGKRSNGGGGGAAGNIQDRLQSLSESA